MNTFKLSNQNIANINGIAILLIALLMTFASGFVLNSQIIFNNDATTVLNIKNSTGLFNLGILLWIFVLLLNVIVAWGLNKYFKDTDEDLSLLSSWLRLCYTSFLAIAIFCLIMVQVIVSNDLFLMAFNPDEKGLLIILFISGFRKISSVGLVLFGFHLLLLGLLTRKSNLTPKIIHRLLISAAICYIFVNIGYLIFPKFTNVISMVELYLSVPIVLGELALALWFLLGVPRLLKCFYTIF